MMLQFPLPLTLYELCERDDFEDTLTSCLRGIYGNENVINEHECQDKEEDQECQDKECKVCRMFDNAYTVYVYDHDGRKMICTLRIWKDDRDDRKMVCITYHTLNTENVAESKNIFNELQMIYLAFLNACKSMFYDT